MSVRSDCPGSDADDWLCSVLVVCSITAGGASIEVTELSVKLVEDDVAGFTVVAGAGVVQEVNQNSSVSINLNTKPMGVVTITAAPDLPLVATPSSVNFNESNWDTPQVMVVSAPDDQELTGARNLTITYR